MAKSCCVCSESKDTAENALFSCSSPGCDVTVHQACYGIVNAPSGLWFCRKCESQERAARVKCELCPRKEGALKRTDSGGWAHVVCALYIPEVTFGNNRRMEPIITTKVPKERFTKSCYICEDRGMETQATYGACMACHKSSCRLAFHVTCAQKEHLLCEEEEQRDSRNIVYCGYCSTHYKKIIRQRFNKPTSSTVPLLPPPITTTSTFPGLIKEREHRPSRVKDRELPQKRYSTDAPIPPQKRKHRARKFSSSNESTTSDAPSNASDIPPRSAPPHVTSPSSVTARSPLSTHTGPGSKIKVEVSESSRTDLLHLQPASSLSQKPEDVARGESHPFSPITSARVSSHEVVPSGREVVPPRRQGGSTSSDQSSVNKTAVGVGFPPRSLHELLERQWEQTAQFIVDQAGSQNNAGMMLAHLHQLQSENSRMQSRIMELASQREFYIAINTRLRQTLTENDNRLPNGVQPSLGEGIQQRLPNANPSSSFSTRVSDNHNQRAASSDTPVDASSSSKHSSSNTLSKAAQDSLLQAHFLAASLNPPGLHYPLLPAGQGGSVSNTQMRDMELRPQQPNIQHLQQNEALLPTTQGVFPTNIAVSQPTGSRLRGTPAHDSERLGQPPPGSNEDITYVTNSIQVPIATFAPLPGGGMNALPTSISTRPQSAANHSYYNRTLNSNKT